MDWLAGNAQDGAPDAVDAQALAEAVAQANAAFTEAMDDDFNAPQALGAVFTLVGTVNAAVADKSLSVNDAQAVVAARDAIIELLAVLGIDVETDMAEETNYPAEVVALAADLAGYGGASPEEAVEALLEARALARKEKNWCLADGVRDGLAGLGFVIEDTPQGARVTYEG